MHDIAKFESKLAAILPPSKAVDQGDVTDIIRQESEPQVEVSNVKIPYKSHRMLQIMDTCNWC